jgi:hypothetical protein
VPGIRFELGCARPFMRTSELPVILAAIAALSFGAAACGGNDDSSSGTGGQASSGSKQTKPVAEVDSLSGRSTAVALDADFVDALKQLKLTPSPLGDASISADGVARFPITGGNVKYFMPGSVSPFVQGEIDHAGSGLQLKGGGKTVQLTDFVVDPGKSVLTGKVTVDGKEAASSAALFFLDGRTLKPLEVNDNGTAVLEGTTVKFKDESAQLLNETFGVDALKGGFEVGVAKITINTSA